MFALFWRYRKTGALPTAATIPLTRTAVRTGRTLGTATMSKAKIASLIDGAQTTNVNVNIAPTD